MDVALQRATVLPAAVRLNLALGRPVSVRARGEAGAQRVCGVVAAQSCACSEARETDSKPRHEEESPAPPPASFSSRQTVRLRAVTVHFQISS
jgi:hypothetical protein